MLTINSLQTAIAQRIARLRKRISEEKLDVFLINDRLNTLYFSGFSCSNSVMIITAERALFLTDFRYYEKALKEIRDCEIVQISQNGEDDLSALLRKLRPRAVGFEGSVSYTQYCRFRRCVPRAKLIEAGRIPAQLRAIKELGEIDLIAANQKLAGRIFLASLRHLQPGLSELALQGQIRAEMVSKSVGEAFETIVACGPNSAFPHATAGNRRIRDEAYLLVDMGVKRGHYHSDMTRTIFLGAPSRRHRDMYELVLEAQQRALDKIAPGVLCCEVDAAARDFIKQHGHEDHFGHGTGHGVGLAIHEAPTLNKRSDDVLQEGMAVTVEPGIYVPGFGGVRIEDLVVVTRKGHRNLTSVGKSFRSVRF